MNQFYSNVKEQKLGCLENKIFLTDRNNFLLKINKQNSQTAATVTRIVFSFSCPVTGRFENRAI